MLQLSSLIVAAVANHGGAMEADTISKNGTSPKSHTIRVNFLSYFIVAAFVVSAAFMSCNKDDGSNGENHRVHKIYNYDNILVAEYFYDNANNLIKKVITENLGNRRQQWAAYTDELEYLNGRVSKIKHRDVSNNMFNYDTYLFYDSQNQLIKSEIYI